MIKTRMALGNILGIIIEPPVLELLAVEKDTAL